MGLRSYVVVALTLAIFALAVQAYPSPVESEHLEVDIANPPVEVVRAKRAPVPQFYPRNPGVLYNQGQGGRSEGFREGELVGEIIGKERERERNREFGYGRGEFGRGRGEFGRGRGTYYYSGSGRDESIDFEIGEMIGELIGREKQLEREIKSGRY